MKKQIVIVRVKIDLKEGRFKSIIQDERYHGQHLKMTKK